MDKNKDKDKDKLLKIMFERLDIAMDFEKSKKIVIPETTCIIRDIMKLKNIGIESKKDSPAIKNDLLNFEL